MLGDGGLGRALAGAGVAVACLALLLLVAGGPGTRAGLWHFRTGLGLLRWVTYAAGGAVVLGLAGALLGGGWRRGLTAVALALLALAGPFVFRRRAAAVPRIHDVSTDLEQPPAFEAVVPLRAGAENPPEHPGAKVAEQQRRAYPDVAPIILVAPPAQAFERALATVRDLGWHVVAADPARGRIEATDTTFWYGFRDDVVIRVRPEGAGSRVDVRSKSRVGKSDVGANAARIRRFRARLAG